MVSALVGLSLCVAACTKVNPEEEPLPNGKLLPTEKITDAQWSSLGLTGNVWALTSKYEFKKGSWSNVEAASLSVFYFQDGSNVSYWVSNAGILDGGKGRWSFDLAASELAVGTTVYKMFPNGKDSIYLLKDKTLGLLTRLPESEAASYRKAR